MAIINNFNAYEVSESFVLSQIRREEEKETLRKAQQERQEAWLNKRITELANEFGIGNQNNENKKTIMENENTKRCCVCGEVKPRSDFYASKVAKDGLESLCKRCKYERKKAYDHAKKEKSKDLEQYIAGGPAKVEIPAKDATPKATDMQVGGDHYKRFEIQPIEFIQRNGLPFIEGNVIKYVCRHRFKNGREDLLKARHYIDMLIELKYSEQ